MKTQELKKYNLPEDRRAIYTIDAKPYGIIIVFVLFGIILTWQDRGLYGGGLVVLSLALFMVLPNRVLMEFYNDYMVLYNRVENNNCVMIYYDEVVNWYYKRGTIEDELVINLVNGNVERIEGFSKKAFEKRLMVFMPNKKLKTSNKNKK